ncbi:hypothetical protein PPUN15366_47760 [Pseudomonas putida]|uniref:hypothetical protein n=1 Tax=Pseudomonas putida TaxID=303 RepID=UPI00235BF960|nr:hypothetical protein [Pseudomonas putida]GLO43128.1 hypothetical protein PPUN15366_47760 [Pseudomonas putida]HDS0977355.1 hypothetical protein [Pseudomonas putida]
MSESTKAPAKKYRSKWTRIAVERATTDGRNSLTADGGFTTNLELESKLPEDTVDGLYEEPKNRRTEFLRAWWRSTRTKPPAKRCQ